MTSATRDHEALSELILSADYRGAATQFTDMYLAGAPAAAMMQTTVDTVAPHVQAPSHLMQLADGRIRGVNFDHTILGWRASMKLAERLGEKAGLLPLTQAIWYVPQGLNVWDQILCKFPGHYARDQEQCDARDGVGADEHAFDGPAWQPVETYFPDLEPRREGSANAQIHEMTDAIRSGRREDGYALFLGLAREKEHREALKEATLFAGIIDIQDTLIDRGAYQNIGHKALRARAMIELADEVGWENGHGMFYSVIPDLGSAPQLHALWQSASKLVESQFPGSWQTLKQDNRDPLTERELEETIDVILWGEQRDVLAHITKRLLQGKALLAIGDAVTVSYSRYIADIADHPNAPFVPGHAFDYCNVIHHWIRTYDNPHQAKALYLEACFVNDVIRVNKQFPRDPGLGYEPANFADWAEAMPIRDILAKLSDSIRDQDGSRAMALVDSYLARTDERANLMATVAFGACRFQNDPHIQRQAISMYEEWEANRTSQRDHIIRSSAKYASHCIKRSTEFGGYDLYRSKFGG
jgi:hypothetical protein